MLNASPGADWRATSLEGAPRFAYAITKAAFLLSLAFAIALDLPLQLGLVPKDEVLLALTLFVAALSLARGRTTVLHGAVPLTTVAAYLVMTVLP